MRWAVGLVFASATGCNLLFDATDGSKQVDAPPVSDTPPLVDAPPACPAQGPPVFTGLTEVFRPERCTHYTQSRSANLATAVCDTSGIVQAPLDSSDFVGMRVSTPGARRVLDLRLAPEGATMYVRTRDGAQIEAPRIDLYHRQADEWVPSIDGVFLAPAGGDIQVSAPSQGPDRRILISTGPPFVVEEWRDSQGVDVWQFVRTYDGPYFGIVSMGQPSMTADGLRMVFIGNVGAQQPQKVLYTDRADVSLPFRADAQTLDVGTGSPQYPYLRDDCGRIYIANVDTTTFKSQ